MKNFKYEKKNNNRQISEASENPLLFWFVQAEYCKTCSLFRCSQSTCHKQEEKRRVDSESAAAMKQIAIEREDARQRLVEERDKFEGEKDLWKRQMLMVRAENKI